MAAAWKTFRVFISSTFRDMHAERDHLVKVVFPALREKLEKHRIYLIDIDLRWGVTREQAENDQALDLCLQQIDECRPFFIGILGERYGWVPTRYPVDALKRFGWIQHHTGKSVTELEILHGVLQDSAMQGRAFFYFRDRSALREVPEDIRLDVYADIDPECIHKLNALKQQIRSSGYPVMENYSARWDAEAYDRPSRSKGRLVDVDKFGQHVHDQLWQAIQEEFQLPEQPSDVKAADPLAEELDYHERFMESRLRVYVGRDKINDELFAFADGNENIPCLLTGASGSGKSAALARFFNDYSNKHQQEIKDGKILVVPHFIGASPRSTNLRDMLLRFCHVFKARFGFAEDVPEELAKLSVTFREFVGKVPADTRVLLVIDALNQLDESDRAQDLYWLPTELPPQVKVIVSCITDSGKTEPALEAFRWRKHYSVQVTALSDAEQRLIIRQVPSLSAKTLDDDQVRLLLNNTATANPLFLLVALEELRGFAPYERLNERIAAFPHEGDTVTAIFIQVVERLAEEFNQKVVETVLKLLASARRGLSERELQELVAGLDSADDLFPVLRQLRPYLLSRAGLIDFYHRSLAEAIARYYFATPEPEKQAHARLANYFRAKADPDGSSRWLGEGPRGFTELLHHLDHAHRNEELLAILDDLGYLDGRCSCGDIHALIDDFQRLPLNDRPMLEFLRRHTQRLEVFKDTFFALLHHEGPATYKERAEEVARTKQWPKPWIRTEMIPLPAVQQASTDGSVRIVTEYNFPISIAVGLAADVHTCFFCKRLGQIGVANIDTGRDYPYSIVIRRDRPLGIFPSNNGNNLAVAYESGNADWFRINYGPEGTPVGEAHVQRFRYALTECEPPKLAWRGEALIYQKEDGAIAQMFAAGHEKTFHLPAGVSGELSGVVASGNHLLVTLRHDNRTTIVGFDGTGSETVRSTRAADVTAVAEGGYNRVAIAFTDRTIAVYKLFPFREIGSVIGELLANCMAMEAKRLVWINSRGAFCTWTIGSQEPPVPLPLRGSVVLRADSIVRARVMASRGDGTFNVVTDSNAFRCSEDSKLGESIRSLRNVFQSSQGEVYALENRDDGWVLRRSNSSNEIRITKADEAHQIYFSAQNGDGAILALNASGPGRFVDASAGSVSEIVNMPNRAGALIGDTHGGFWLGDRFGRIYYLLQQGYRKAADSMGMAARHPRLVIAGPYLIWAGGANFEGEQGTDSVDAFVFYRCDAHNILTRIGEHYCTKAFGTVEDIAGDSSDSRLWTASNSNMLRVGTIDDYIHNCWEEIPLTLFATIDQLRLTLKHIWILDKQGSLYCFDKMTRQRLAYLAPSLPVGTLSASNIGALSLVAIQNKTQLLRIHCEGIS